MATEIDIPMSVSLQKGEREDDTFSSEFSEGKVTEHPGNRVKQLESRLNQAVETSSHVAETVNTQLESDKRTDEGGIFFQALSVPVATAAEHIKTPDSCETTTAEDQEDGSGASKIETLTEEKPNDDERVAVIAVKETDDKSVDAQQASEQSENGARDESEQKPVEIEQEEETEVIKPIVEKDEKIEQKDGQEETTESDDGRKETSDITMVKEVCEEAASEKVESEKEVELSDISSMKLEEKATTTLNKDDDQEKEQEVNMSEKSQDEDNIKPELVETKEIIEKDTQEIEHNATTPTEPEERTPKNEEKNEEVIDSNDDQTKKSEEVSNLPDDSSMVSNENVIASKEDQDKFYVSEKGQGDGDVTSSQNASTEFIKETTTSQHATAPAYFEEGQELNVTPKDILKEEEDDRTTYPQEESEQCENEAEDKREQKQEESVNEIVHSSLEIEQEHYTEEIKPSEEKPGHVMTADASNSTQTESHEESAEHEVNNEEATIESDEGVKLSDNSSMKQNEEPVEILRENDDQEMEHELNSSEKDQGEDDATCEETVPEKANDNEESLIHSDSRSIVLNENEIVSKDEYQEKEQEFYESEKGQHGGDDVTSSRNASSEDIKEMIDQHATKVAYFEEVQGLNAMAKDEDATDRMIVPQEASEQNENEANDKREQKPEEIMHSGLGTEQDEYAKEIKPSVQTEVKEEQEGLVGISSQTEIQVESQLEATEHKKEVIESDDGPKEKANNPSIKEVCEEIDAGKVEYEGVQLSDDSSEKLNEKAIAISSKDDNREKEQALKIEQDQHEDGVPSSQDATSVEDLQAKSHDGEGQEPEVVETREGIEENNEEIEPSVERKEKVEQEEGLLHATTTDVCIITQRKSQEEAIKSNDDQREKSNDALVEEVCKEVGSEKVESEEGIKLSDNSNTELNEKAIAILSKDEDQENEQELGMQEETQGEEEVTCSQEASSGKDLEGKNYHGEHSESKLVENKDGIKEDVEVISANVDTEEVKEQGSLSVTVSDVCMSAQTEPKEETTKDGESIESYDGPEEILVIPCVNEACEETGLESIVAQEASNQYENEAKDKREQDLVGSANKPVHFHSEIGEATTKEDETNAEDKEEAYFEKSKFEASDETECKTAGETQNISAENKDDAIADDSKSTENPCTAEQDILEEVGEKTTMKPEEITKQASQESQSETNKEIDNKLDVEEHQTGGREDGSEMKDETVLIENVSTELEQPMEQNVEENQACRTTTMNEKIEDEIAKKDGDLSLGSIELSDDNSVKEEKSFLDGKTREIEISTLEHEPVEEKTTTKSEEITKQDFQVSQSETNKEIEAKLDTENQVDGEEDESEMTNEVVLSEKMSSEHGQPMEQNVDEIQACGTTTTSEKIEDDITEKIEDLSLGSIEDKNDNDIKEESLLDRRTKEIEISTFEHAPVGEKTTMEPEDITNQVIQESQIETNKEIEAKLDAEYQVDGREHKSEMKDDVVMTKEMSSELGQRVEQNAEKIEACRTTTMSEKIEDEIAEKNEDLSHGNVEDKDDNTVKEEKSFLDEKTTEIETTTLDHAPIEEKTTTNSEEITKQAFQESEIETNKEIDTKLDAKNQADKREDRREMKDEIVLAEKMSSELGQPMEQNVEEIQACQTTTMNEKIEDDITKKEEDLSQGNIEVSNDNTIKEEESFPNRGTREIEISTFEHEPVDEKTTIKPEEITKQAFQESQSETKKIQAKLDVENQVDEREDRSEMNDEVVLDEKMSLELEQPMEENIEEMHSCQTTTMSGEIEDEITKKNEDLSLGNIEDKDGNTVKEEKSFLDEKTREIETSTLEHEPVREKTTTESEEITKHAFQESEIETNMEIDTKLDAKNQAEEREDRRETKDEVVLTEKMSLELEQPVEENIEEIHSCQTTTVSGKIEDEITGKNEDLSLGNIEDKDDNVVKEEKSFLDEKTTEIEISILEHVSVGEKTTIEPEDITKQAFQESEIETNKEIEAKLDAEYQADERQDRNEIEDEVVLTKKISSELEQPIEQNVEEIQACQMTTMNEKVEEEITKKDKDLSLGNIEMSDDNTIKEEESFLGERTRAVEISAFEHEPIREKTIIKPEEITEHASQESQSETKKEIEAKLDAKNQVDEREDKSEMKDEVVLTEKMSLELEQPMEDNVEEMHSCQTTTVSGKIENEITGKNEDLSLGSIENKDDNIVKEEKSFLDEKTKEIEISTLEHVPVSEKTTMKPEDITKQAFQESEIETNKEIEAELDAEYQAHGREDRREMKDEVVLTEKMSLELGQPMDQNVEEIHTCQTTTMSEKIEDDIAEKNEDLSLGNREDKDDNIVKEETSFLDGNAREIEISTLENVPVVKLEEITEQAFQESQVETNKETEAKLDAKNQADEGEERREIKDEVVLTEKLSSELGQPMEQNVVEILACQTTTMDKKIEDEIAKKEEDLSQGNIEVSNDIPIKEEESFLDGRTREIEISTFEYEPVDEKTTIKPKEITKQAFQESQRETKELEAKLDAENQVDEREDRSEMNHEVVLAEKISSELGQPTEQNIEEIQACQTTTMTEKTEDGIAKNEDLSHDSIEDTNENIANEEKSFLDGKTREIEISTSEHEAVEEKNGGLDEVSKKKDTDLNEATTVELQEDFIPSISPGTSTDNTPNSENSKAESENLPIEDLDFVSEVQIPIAVPNSEDSNVKEECLISATTTTVDEERGTVTKETSSDEISYSDPIPVENPEVIKVIADDQIGQEVADSEESKVKEERIDLATAEYADENNGDEEQEIKTNEILSVEKKEQTTESKQVVEHSCPDAVLNEENLELHGELKPASELTIDEDPVDETKPQPEQSNITSEQVVVETEKEEGSTEVKRQDFEEDKCPKELEKTSTSNQKELANEIEVSESIPIGNTEVAEIESIDTPSNDQDDMKLTQSRLIEQKGVLSSQLTDREILEEEATENRKEAPNHEFEKDEKDDGLISEIQTPEENLKMEIKEEHLEATNDSYETVTGGLSSEKLLDEVKEIDAKEDTEKIVRQEEKVVEDSYQVAEVTAHDHLSQTEEKLVTMAPPEELTLPTAEDQTNELVSETDKTKVEHSSISSKDWNPELMEEKFTNTLLEDQRSVKEQYIEEEGQDNVGAESKEAKSGNEVVKDVVNEVLLEVEKSKESDNINKEGSFIPNQLTSATDEICQIKSLDSSPNELLEQDKEVKSEEISGPGDTHKLEEEPTEVSELPPKVDEIVDEGTEVSAMSMEDLPEASPEMLLVKQDPETTTAIEKSEEEIKDKDETLVNMDSSTSSKEVACLSNEKAGELQVSTMNAEGKQDGLIDMLNKETEAVQPQEHISNVEIREQGELVHCGSQEPSEDNSLPSQNDEKIADLLVIPSVSKETIQCVDKTFEEAPAIDDQKHENDLDYTANARVIDVVSKAESPEIEQQHHDTKGAKVEPINQENQSGQTKEESENIESEIPIEKVPKPTAAHEETANEFLVMPVSKEEEKSNYLQDYSKEEEHSGKRTYEDLEVVTEPSQTDKLSDDVKKAESIDTQEETKAEGKLHEEKTGKRTKITEAAVDLHHGEKGGETNCKATSMEAAIPIEYVKSSDMVKGDLDASVPKCASTRNPEVRSAILEVLSVMDTTDDKAGYNKDPNVKTAEAHEAGKEVINEDVHLESTSDISKTTEKISGTNQEPFNLPLTKERSMELDAPVIPDTASTEHVPNSHIDASHEQGKPTAKSLNASGTEPQCSSEVVKEEKKISDGKEKPETPERATVVLTDILHEPTQGDSKVAENLIEERELDLTKDEQVDKEETGDKGAKTDEEDEAEEDDEDNQKTGDAPVMIEASKDMEVKTPKKSHNILSGVGSKVKHSIAKVKKAITGKSSSPKPPSPKARD